MTESKSSQATASVCGETHPPVGSPVRTACGGVVTFGADTVCALYRGKPVYFCLQVCKEDYELDPVSSCLAARIMADK
jgi:YHS domain-containing protein